MAAEDLGHSMSGGFLPPIPASASREEQIGAINEVIARLNNMLKAQVYSDATTKRFLQGYQAGGWEGGDFGMKISLPGVDVTKATAEQLLFSWDYTTNKQIFYDPDIPGRDIGHQGILPNGKGGSAWAKDGESVLDAFGIGGES